MAKQEDKKGKLPVPSIKVNPKLVDKIDEGFTFSHKDENGNDVYKKQSDTPKHTYPVKPIGIDSKYNNIPRDIVQPKPRQKPPTEKIEYQYMLPKIKEPELTQKPQYLRSDMRQIFPGGLPKGYTSHMVPDLESGGNYAKAKNIVVDPEGMPVSYDFKTNQYNRTGEANIYKTMPVQNDTPTIQAALKENELPTAFDTEAQRLRTGKYNTAKLKAPIVDTATYKGFNDVGTSNAINNAEFQIEQAKKLAVPKLKKGGIVGKIKGYYDGGEVNPYLSGNPNIPNQGQQFTNNGNANNFYSAFGSTNGVNSGVVNQADTYGKARIDADKKTKEEKDAKNKETLNKTLNTVSSGLGAYGQTYAATAKPSGSQDSTTKSAMGAVSGMGAVGGVVGGVYGIIDQVARPEKNKAEAMDITYDSQGNATAKLASAARAKDTAIAGSFLSPSEALTTRMSYKGGMTDVSGKGYTDYLEKKAQEQLDVYNKANKEYKTKQALAARDAGNFNARINNKYNLRDTSFNDNKQLEGVQEYAKGGVVSRVKNMYSKGGEIKGKGTGTSDSINAKVEEGSFVVPAKNAELAKGIRNLYLKVPSKKANINQKEGEEVKLSNGEHLFSPEENEYLESIGVDLESLAPNAEKEEDGMAKGGPVLSDKEVKQALENTKAKQLLLKEQLSKQVADYEKNPNKDPNQLPIINSIKEKIKKINTEFGDSKGYALPTAKVNKNSSKTYNELITPPLSWTGSKEAWKSAADKAIREGKVIPKDNVKVATNTSLKAPKIAQKVQAGKFTPSTASYDPKDDITVPGDNLSPLERAKLTASENKANADAAALNSSLPQTLPTESYSSQRKGSGILGKLGNIDPTAFLGAGQTALGYNMLRGQVRPKDNAVIDPTYNASVNRSLQDATFGLTPEQKFAADQDIQNSLNDAKAVGLNYSGGSGVQAFNTNRAAINDAWKAKLGLSVADTDLRMQKQKYADAMAADRASILASNRRQAFNDAMEAFQQNQNAGSELIGAGLQNTIGAYRFNKIMNQQEQENAARNPYLNYNP